MSTPHILIAGRGKLARELLAGLGPQASAWREDACHDDPAPQVVVHAGSGRELAAVVAYCLARGLPLVELSTGTAVTELAVGLPVVVCPNANLLVLKFMTLLERSGGWFSGGHIRLVESHQSGKTSVPGTAVAMAQALGLDPARIESVRDPAVQVRSLGIAPEDLPRHAFHRIEIEDGPCTLRLETRVRGDEPYVDGVRRIATVVAAQALAPRAYRVTEFIENGWL
jgi:4-hydroxy-tetrahydrodipicolinate reductase